ncbi:unnamed protein product [Chondrus crispus]|uniref:Uncharacterized protein n=1 Tax=Chondrus crispus TaxID=2769 RepID=R7Q5Z8_CHOCR|nr:unnamed protein product [Chondrus crispus]CDF33942.1 unnamed protein product [Chondrus crispus]|eukprot:XP_005713761.1 unnamed protein product [Chondrus crispus]
MHEASTSFEMLFCESIAGLRCSVLDRLFAIICQEGLQQSRCGPVFLVVFESKQNWHVAKNNLHGDKNCKQPRINRKMIKLASFHDSAPSREARSMLICQHD